MIFGVVTFWLVFFSFLYLLFSLYSVWRFSGISAPSFFPNDSAPVSILKPVRGLTSESEKNFRSFLRQDYPEFQIIFGVQDHSDPVIPLLVRLKEEFKDRDIFIAIDPKKIGINPKISNLYNMVRHAHCEILVISDSDVEVKPDYLRTVAASFRDNSVGVVTCIYKAKCSATANVMERLVMALESLSISVEYKPGALTARQLGKTGFAFGQTMAIKKNVLDKIGGFEALANCNSDDYQLGARTVKAGFKVELAQTLVENVLSPERFREFCLRKLRWFRSIKACEPWGYMGSFIAYLLPLALLNLVVWRWGIWAWIVLFLSLFAKIFVALINNRLFLQDSAVRSYWWLIPFSEIIGFALWCWSWIPAPVVWYGEKYVLKRDGMMEKAG